MRYFKLRLTRLNDELLFETDFLAEQFDSLIRELASILVQQKLFRDGESYDARLIPQTGQFVDTKKALVLEGAEIKSNGQGFLDIAFEKAAPPVEAITYLTTQIRSPELSRAYRFDWSLDMLLAGVLTDVTQLLLDGNVLNNGERFKLGLSAHEGGRPRIDPLMMPRTMVKAKPLQLKVKDRKGAALTSDVAIEIEEVTPAAADEIEILVESVEELIKPQQRSLKAYSEVEPIGDVAEQDLPIYVRRGALQRIRKAADASTQANEEVGGFLVGSILRDPDSERLYVDIAEVVEADQAHGTYVSINFDYKAWRQVLDRIDRDLAGQFLVGWYHTHLVSQAVVLKADEAENEYLAVYSPFLSQADLFIHRNFFPDPWHVALVMDLRCGQDAFFAWSEGKIAPTHGYYLYGE